MRLFGIFKKLCTKMDGTGNFKIYFTVSVAAGVCLLKHCCKSNEVCAIVGHILTTVSTCVSPIYPT
jgi:hypothetical protein